MTVTLHLGDCLEYMRGMADKLVDAVITDPPYGISVGNFPNNAERWNAPPKVDVVVMDWDKNRVAEFIPLATGVSKHQVIFGGNYYADLLPASRGWIVWDKKTSGNFSACELAWTSHDKALAKYEYLWNGFRKEHPEQRYHPTQKPLALMLWVMENYTDEGDTIFDPFMGSGTTGVAAVQLGRNFIGAEINPDYYAIAQRRIKQAQEARQLELV